MELHSIYARFSMEPQDFNRWLESTTPVTSDFDDWSRMNLSWRDSWKEDFPELSAMTVKELLDEWKDDEYNQSPLFTSYDPVRREFVLFQAMYDENLIGIAIGIARLRGAQQFCTAGTRSYVLVAPLFWEPGITALLELADWGSSFLQEDDIPPGLMNEAGVLLDEYMSDDSAGRADDTAERLNENKASIAIPGSIFMPGGKEDYVGGMPALTGTLFFKDVQSPAVRDAICACFKEYQAVAGEYLTWLWREEPANGKNCAAYRDAKPMPELMKNLSENDPVAFAYVSGKKQEDAGEWEFQASGYRARKGLSFIRFSMPIQYTEDHPLAFQAMFVKFADLLKVVHGYGGYGLVLSWARQSDNEPIEAHLAGRVNGFDVGSPTLAAAGAGNGIKTVSWVTAIDNELVDKVGGMTTLRSALPMDWFALYPYRDGVVIQAGPSWYNAPVDEDPQPACYVLPNMLLKDVRSTEMGDLHEASAAGELRIRGDAVVRWMARFDVPPDELLGFKDNLEDEPKLTEETTLPQRL